MARHGATQRSRASQLKPLSSHFLLSLVAMSLPTAEAQTTPAPTTTDRPTTLATSSSRAASSSAAGRINGSGGSAWPNADGRPFAQNDDDDGRPGGLVNYYFVFLAIFILLAFLGIYFLNRRRRARKMAFQNSGQDALARDVDGWNSNARGWHWRNGSRNDRNEGLNELGQAPPAYTAKPHIGEPSTDPAATSSGPQIPLAALAREGRDRDMHKPPEYAEAVRTDSATGSQSAPASRPETSPAPAPPASEPASAPAPAPASAPTPAENSSR